MEEAIHFPCAPDPDMVGVLFGAEEMRAWALELKNGGSRREGVGERGEPLSLYKGGRNYAPPHLPIKIAYFPSVTIDGAIGLPIPVLMKIP